MRSLKLLKITSLATEFHINLYHFHSTTLMLISRVETGVDLIGFPSFSSLAYNTFSLPDFVVTLRYHYGCRTPCRLFCLLTNTSLGPFVLICVGKRSGDRTRPINEIVQPDYKHFLSPIPCFQHNRLYFHGCRTLYKLYHSIIKLS